MQYSVYAFLPHVTLAWHCVNINNLSAMYSTAAVNMAVLS
jgi:hypothetical protein